MSLFKKDIFGNYLILKRILIFVFGLFSYNRYNGFNDLEITGAENLKLAPETNVLIVSNHQTYFADVFAMMHVLFSFKNGYINTIKNPIYLFKPMLNIYYVAAKETMRKGILTKLFAYTGAIEVVRSWRSEGKAVKRNINKKDPENIFKALSEGWVITFPQGTTTAFAPGRKGTAQIIMKSKCTVVPVVIDGFRRAYDKKGINIKVKGVKQTMRFKKPLEFDFENEDAGDILNKIMVAIEQTPEFLKVEPIEKKN